MALESMEVEGVQFAAIISSPRTAKELVLAGAGFRSVNIAPEVILKVTSVGIYVEEELLGQLALKWRGKSSSDLLQDDEFFLDIISSQFEKCAKVALLKPLTGVQYSEKVIDHTKAELGEWGDAEAEAIQKFLNAFKQENFVPGSAIYLFFSPAGLTIAFAHQAGEFPEVKEAADFIDNRHFGEAVLSTILGPHSVSPHAKASIATRTSTRFNSSLHDSVSQA